MTPHQTIGQVLKASRTPKGFKYLVWEPTGTDAVRVYSESELSPTTNEIPKPYSFE